MALYVIIVFVCLLAGMGISIMAFGTGTKKSKVFKEIYFSIEEIDGNIGVIYTKTGEYSAILKLKNPVPKNGADIDRYYEFNNTIVAILQALGEGYALHKQEIFTRKGFHDESPEDHEFLSESYFNYFEGREYTAVTSYITITQQNKKSSLFTYDSRKWKEFVMKVNKVKDQLKDRGVEARFLNKYEANKYVGRYFAQNFKDAHISADNFKVGDELIEMGEKKFKIYSLVDVDTIDLPQVIKPYTNIEVNNTSMPVDLMTCIDSIPEALNVIYNQIIYIPSQKQELGKLQKKRNRHSSLPSPSNQIAVEDIKQVEERVARENQMLVYAHYNLIVTVPHSADIQRCTNHLENVFSRCGIHMSQKAYNQLELFVGSFPGNCYQLNEEYDRFLTLAPAAACLMYKEHLPETEDSPFLIHYTDRQGVPIGIDLSGKEGKVKMTDNSNFFCLGPSGSGKSFHMNSVIRQMHEQNTDVVMVDTGNSYERLCQYFNGKYISYTEEKPITMNPFRISREERNIEKIGFLKNLIMLIWKGSQGEVSKTEDTLINNVINEYYDVYFDGFHGYTASQRSALHQSFLLDLIPTLKAGDDPSQLEEKISNMIDESEERRKAITVKELSFNSFYEYSVLRIPHICAEEKITGIDFAGYRFMMKGFYRGGTHEKTLNEELDSTLFDETFIVFEIDNIKDDPLLFPLVTLIIMDVFIQKMRIKKNRKILVIEEAWKAIASPMMAEYIKYLYKTARKFWATVGVVTQELQDIIGSEIVKESIINNSDIIILLDQSKFKERFDDIQTILGLTDVEKTKIFTINRLENKDNRAFFREVFIRRGSVSEVYGVEEPLECYMAYTTERSEKEALKIYVDYHKGDIKAAIRAYVADWKKSGVKASIGFAQMVNKAGHVLNLQTARLN